VVGIAKVAESGRLGIAMAEFPLQAEGLLVVGDGLLLMAQEVVGVADGV